MSEKSLAEVAKRLGVSKATLSRIERGKMPDGNTLARIIRYLLEEE